MTIQDVKVKTLFSDVTAGVCWKNDTKHWPGKHFVVCEGKIKSIQERPKTPQVND